MIVCRSCNSTAGRATLAVELSRDLLDRLGLYDRCADCFWWRLALLLGYCAF